jgi:predicted amidophosphoribosyltransferase
VKALLKSFYPRCQNCDQPSFEIFCDDCFEKLKFQKICAHCGRGPLSEKLLICLPCTKISKAWNKIFISFLYEGGVQDWIREIKDHSKPERYRELKRNHLPETLFDEKYDGLIAVTSDPTMASERLFDSAEILALQIAKLIKFPLLKNIFKRSPFLQSQRELDKVKRLTFLSKTIRLTERLSLSSESLSAHSRQKILLIDDVMTTGASLEIHSKLLKSHGFSVDVFCLARTPKIL